METKRKERYINFYTDFAFKRFFGTEVNKDLLISFLNALLAGKEKIKNISFLNSERFGPIEVNRKAIFDVYCQNDRGEYFIVEMQKAEQQFFKDRSIFYSTFPIREQAVKGTDWDYQLKAVYTIGILNFCLEDSNPDYYNCEVKLMDTRTHKVFYDKLTYIYLEMPKFNKSLCELETVMDKWMYAIRHLPELLEKPKIMAEEIFTRLFEQAEIAHFTPVEMREYEESLKVYRDWYSISKTTFEKGRAKGLKEGHAEGHKEGLAEGLKEGHAEGLKEGIEMGRSEGLKEGIEIANRQTALKMKLAGVDTAIISAITGLPPALIDQL